MQYKVIDNVRELWVSSKIKGVPNPVLSYTCDSGIDKVWTILTILIHAIKEIEGLLTAKEKQHTAFPFIIHKRCVKL